MAQPSGSFRRGSKGSKGSKGSSRSIALTPMQNPRRSPQDSGDESAAPSDSSLIRDTELPSLSTGRKKRGFLSTMGFRAATRQAIGICFVLGTVLLWTSSNFMASFIFSDQTYDKPFFVAFGTNIPFALATIPYLMRYLARRGFSGLRHDIGRLLGRPVRAGMGPDEDDETLGEHLLAAEAAEDRDVEGSSLQPGDPPHDGQKLSPRETAAIALEMCIPWLLSEYLSSACLAYTSVASYTILTSTTSIWIFVFGALSGVVSFSRGKAASVAASLAGIIIISSIDLSGGNGGDDPNRGSFPSKTLSQIALGDIMAFVSAVIYAFTTVLLKKRVVSDDGKDMQLVLALAGLFTVMLSWPLLFLLHWTGVETFELPPTRQIWAFVAFNWISTYLGDVLWAYSILLISPLVVSVGLTTTIPLSLIGEMIQYGQYSSFMYWVGASIVVLSFIFISIHGKEQDSQNIQL